MTEGAKGAGLPVAVLFAPEIARVRQELKAGRAPSDIANSLHAEVVSPIQMLAIFREVTGASIPDLKAFGQWWGHQGVTDPAAFDDWARTVLRKVGGTPR
jgi:hypothetical protein